MSRKSFIIRNNLIILVFFELLFRHHCEEEYFIYSSSTNFFRRRVNVPSKHISVLSRSQLKGYLQIACPRELSFYSLATIFATTSNRRIYVFLFPSPFLLFVFRFSSTTITLRRINHRFFIIRVFVQVSLRQPVRVQGSLCSFFFFVLHHWPRRQFSVENEKAKNGG